MAIAKMIATFRCDGCNKAFNLSMDPAQRMNGVTYGFVHDYALDILAKPNVEGTSIQGGHDLCVECTKFIDEKFPDENVHPTYDQVCAALNERAGV